jgi:hypothetical protein
MFAELKVESSKLKEKVFKIIKEESHERTTCNRARYHPVVTDKIKKDLSEVKCL